MIMCTNNGVLWGYFYTWRAQIDSGWSELHVTIMSIGINIIFIVGTMYGGRGMDWLINKWKTKGIYWLFTAPNPSWIRYVTVWALQTKCSIWIVIVLMLVASLTNMHP